MSFAYLPLFTGDYLRDTQHLSMSEHGAFLKLLMFCWDQKGPAPLDERKLCGIVNARSGDEVEALRRIIAEFFVCMEDGFYNKRMQREVERSEAISSKRSVAALSRHGRAAPVEVAPGQRVRSARLSDARAIATHSKQQWDALVEFHGGMCCKCGSQETMMVKDHITPLHQGGHDGIQNLQPLCYRCNAAKGKDSTDFRRSGWDVHLHASAEDVQARRTTPSPSLSLTQDQTKEKKTKGTLGVAELVSVGVKRQHAEDWLRARKEKRLPLTLTALDGVKAEAVKAGMTLPEAIEKAAGEGWGGFKASWLTAGGAAHDPNAVAAEAMRMMEARDAKA